MSNATSGYRGFDATVEMTWRPSERVTVLVGSSMILDYEKLSTVYDVLKSSIGTGAGERAGDQIPAMAVAGTKSMSNHGLNAMVVWSAMPWLTVTGGARYDYHSVYGAKPSGRLAGVVELRQNLHLKLLYGSAFKAPSPQLLYGSPLAPGDIAGNDKLKPSYVPHRRVAARIPPHAIAAARDRRGVQLPPRPSRLRPAGHQPSGAQHLPRRFGIVGKAKRALSTIGERSPRTPTSP